MIKYVRGTIKIQHEEEIKQKASQEEQFINEEKSKYEGDDSSKQELNHEKLKIAQVIDREQRMNKMWEQEDENDEESDQEETKGRGAQDRKSK